VFLEQHSPGTLKVKTLDKDNLKVSRVIALVFKGNFEE
jgi:hypothetical protein